MAARASQVPPQLFDLLTKSEHEPTATQLVGCPPFGTGGHVCCWIHRESPLPGCSARAGILRANRDGTLCALLAAHVRTIDKAPGGKSRKHIPHKEPAGGTATLEAAAAVERNRLRRYLRILGPGLITGASDDDPSGIGTYAMAGASFGFSTLWVSLVTFPMMTAVQFICAKIGMVTGQGLARVLRKHYSSALLYPVVGALVVANTINAGTDIGAIAAAVNLVVPVSITMLIAPIALIILG